MIVIFLIILIILGSCISTISHKFDGKGTEMTSELKLQNLTHINIGKYPVRPIKLWNDKTTSRLVL